MKMSKGTEGLEITKIAIGRFNNIKWLKNTWYYKYNSTFNRNELIHQPNVKLNFSYSRYKQLAINAFDTEMFAIDNWLGESFDTVLTMS